MNVQIMNAHVKMYLSLCLACCFFLSAGCTYTTIHTRQHQVFFQYMEQHRSERDLPICSGTSVCTVLHSRYWLPAIGQRLCRCGTPGDECSWRWAQPLDNNTMALNNRSQLKFCSRIDNLKKCNPHQAALITTQEMIGANITYFDAQVQCYCPPDRYWKQWKTEQHEYNHTTITTRTYKCGVLHHCRTMEFCGNVRTDHRSIYYRCSCPYHHQCLYSDDSITTATELFYKGSVYKAICKPDPGTAYDY